MQVLLNKYTVGLLAALLTAGGSFFLGYKKGSDVPPQVVHDTKIVETAGKTMYKDRIVTVTKIVKPDGTTTETTKTEDKQKETETTTTKKEDVAVVVTPPQKKYSLGLLGMPKWDRTETSILKRIKLLPGVTAGYNVGNDFWLKFGYVPADNTSIVSVEMHF